LGRRIVTVEETDNQATIVVNFIYIGKVLTI